LIEPGVAETAGVAETDFIFGWKLSRLGWLVVEQAIKKPPMNGGISQVIPITWRFDKCSASRQVCAVGPLDLVEPSPSTARRLQIIHRAVEKFADLCCRRFFKWPAITEAFR